MNSLEFREQKFFYAFLCFIITLPKFVQVLEVFGVGV